MATYYKKTPIIEISSEPKGKLYAAELALKSLEIPYRIVKNPSKALTIGLKMNIVKYFVWSAAITGWLVISITLWFSLLNSPDTQTFVFAVDINKYNEFWLEFFLIHTIIILLVYVIIKWFKQDYRITISHDMFSKEKKSLHASKVFKTDTENLFIN